LVGFVNFGIFLFAGAREGGAEVGVGGGVEELWW